MTTYVTVHNYKLILALTSHLYGCVSVTLATLGQTKQGWVQGLALACAALSWPKDGKSITVAHIPSLARQIQ